MFIECLQRSQRSRYFSLFTREYYYSSSTEDEIHFLNHPLFLWLWVRMALLGISKSLLSSGQRQSTVLTQLPVRTVIYYSFKDGTRENDQGAVDRFYRLHWGGWIHAKPGRGNLQWRRSWWRKWYDKHHFLCNQKEVDDLEKMITPLYKKPRHFINDPYEPYHKRHNIDIVPTGRRKTSASYVKLVHEY